MWFLKSKTCLNLNLSLGLSRAEDGACTIEAVAAKVAVPQAQALQTPAAFSPTPESTEFDPFCSLRPQLICPGLHTQPSLARQGPWDFSSRTMKKDISPSLCFPSTVLCNYVQCQFFGSLCASKSSGHFLHRRKRMITNQEWNSPSRFFSPNSVWLSL